MHNEKLFHEPLTLTPRTERPLLCVRRWVFWNEQGHMVRDIPLEAGLNIVTALDIPATDTTPGIPGHGVGKTSFCRLLRFGLGDDLDATLRGQLAIAFGVCRLGLLVNVGATTLTIVRSIADETAAVVVGDSIADGPTLELRQRGMRPLYDHLNDASADASATAWTTLLPMVTREQEARRSLETWRVEQKGTIETRTIAMLKAFGLFSAVVASSDEALKARDNAEDEVDDAKTDIRFMQRRLQEIRTELNMEKPPEKEDITVAAQNIVAEAIRATQGPASEALIDARRLSEELAARLARAKEDFAVHLAAIKTRDEILTRIDNDRVRLEGAEAQQARASMTLPAVCSCCGQLLQNTEAKEHYRSAKAIELASTRAQLAELHSNYAALKAEAETMTSMRQATAKLIREIDGQWQASLSKLDDLEAAHHEARGAAQHLRGEAEKLHHMIWRPARSPQARVKKRSPEPELDILRRREHLSRKYEAVMQALIDDDARAALKFAGNALEQELDHNGPVGGTALNFLSVLAFDIAAMILRAEAALPGPAFLIHDSPREGDLSPILYDRYFTMLQRLHELGGHGFQIIVTTTSPVPATPRTLDERVRARLSGRPEDRLLFRAL